MHPHRYNNNKKKKKVMKDVKERIFIDGVNDWRRGGGTYICVCGMRFGENNIGLVCTRERERERDPILEDDDAVSIS